MPENFLKFKMGEYNPQKTERKWQRIWEKTGIFKTPDRINKKKNFYHLVMFPYPSGDLHIGHWYNFVGADVYARLKRMQDLNVMSPMGFDAFGLPAENAAIRHGIHPKNWTYKNIKRMKKQLKSIGACYDWEREIITSDPKYYKWTQWIFLKMYKAHLAYRTKIPANFCPSCKTVLANEQVIEGSCERCDSQVIQKEIEQWLFKITAHTEDLLKDLDDLDWLEATKLIQKNWIGKSEGWDIEFGVKTSTLSSAKEGLRSVFKIPVFTTRPETLFGATYLVLAPEHPIIEKLKSEITNYRFVKDYIEEAKKKTEKERIGEVKEKAGIEIKGIKAINPANSREIPVWVADYVLIHYGTGAIMAVPGHDQRDLDFAKKYNLPVIEVIKPCSAEKILPKRTSLVVSDGRFEKAFEEGGILINSGRFDGLKSEIAKKRIAQWLDKLGLAKKSTYYKLRDWIISRQRYWGCPIPMVFCQKCGWQPVAENNLPVLLPKIRDFWPTGEGKSPLAKSRKFIETNCPKCQGYAQRETDTMDTFVCSSWYYLRYADPKNEKKFVSKTKLKNWLPVDMYIGGTEHACLHLLYSRFFTKFLKNMGYLNFKEPFLTLRHQGIILGPDGQKMSKSRGNVIDPDEQVKKYGSDVVRMYLCFMGPYDQGGPWGPTGITGIYRFLQKVWRLFNHSKPNIKNNELKKIIHQTIKKVTADIENLRFNTAISALMTLVNEMVKQPAIEKKQLKILLLLLAPLAPFLTEEIWYRLGNINSIHNQKFPKYNPKFIKEEKTTLIIQVNGRVRDKFEVEQNLSEKKVRKLTLKREKIKKWIEGKKIKKVIFVHGKLINIVV